MFLLIIVQCCSVLWFVLWPCFLIVRDRRFIVIGKGRDSFKMHFLSNISDHAEVHRVWTFAASVPVTCVCVCVVA